MTTETTNETPVLIKKTQQLQAFIVITLVGGSVVAGAIAFVTSGLASKYINQVQEYQNVVQTQAGIAHLLTLADSKQSELMTVSQAFPDDSSIIEVMQQLETLVHNFDPTGTVHFAPQGQVRTNNQLGVVLQFTLHITPTELIAFMRQFEHLPYILEITRLEIKTPQGVSNPAEIDVGVILYVQDPFSQPN